MRLHKGQAVAIGKKSPKSLYSYELATYDRGDQYDHGSAVGFIKIWGLPVAQQARTQLLAEGEAPFQLGHVGVRARQERVACIGAWPRCGLGLTMAIAASVAAARRVRRRRRSPKPPPAVVATADAISREVQHRRRRAATPSAASVRLNGHVFGSGATGIVLAHMRLADQTAWYPVRRSCSPTTGRFTVLTFDFRGFGESPGDKEFDHLDTDLAAALGYMRTTLGVDKIFLVGASTGGTASLVVGARERGGRRRLDLVAGPVRDARRAVGRALDRGAPAFRREPGRRAGAAQPRSSSVKAAGRADRAAGVRRERARHEPLRRAACG